MGLFSGHEGVHGTHGEPHRDGLKWSIKRTASTHREAVTEEMWVAHLEGRRPLGIVPIRADSTCRWGSIDVDQYDLNLPATVQRVENSGLPLIPCQSKSGGLHLFVLLHEPHDAGEVVVVEREMAARLGFGRCEIFPKQSQVLTERGDFGSWMIVPYFGGTFDGKLRPQVGIKRTGAEMSLPEFIEACEARRLTVEELRAIMRPVRRRNDPGTGSEVGPFSDGPPCLAHLAVSGVEPGGQNNALLHMGIYYKRAFPMQWKEKLEEANSTFLQPPGSAEGLVAVVHSLERKDYEYTCRAEPMRSHCDSAACRLRRFGVGDSEAYPQISSLSKLNTVPPAWFIEVDGRRVEANTDQLHNFILFQKLCMDQIDTTFRTIKQTEWIELVRVAMADLIPIPAAEDAGVPGQFRELLEQFLTNRSRGTRREDLLNGRPWEDEEEHKHFFKLSALRTWLQRQGVHDMGLREVTRYIEGLEGGAHVFNISGTCVNVRWVPSSAIRRTPRVDPPPLPQEPM